MNESSGNGTSMLKYLGVKSVYAEPMLRGPYLGALGPNQAVSETTFNEQGYKVVYPDGYTSWSPKEVFEKAYKLLPEGVFGLIIDYDPRDGGWAYINLQPDELAIKPKSDNANLYCIKCGKEEVNENERCSCGCGVFKSAPEPLNRGVNMADESPVLKLHAPSRYPLAECLEELKFGRTASDQLFLVDCLNKLKEIEVNDLIDSDQLQLEINEFNKQIEKLSQFLDSKKLDKLSVEHQKLLSEQIHYMFGYESILTRRFNLLNS